MSIRPDLLAVLPQLVADQITEWLPHLATCKGSVGRIDLAEVKRQGIAAPAVLVSRFGTQINRTLSGPHRHYLTDMSAFVITRNTVNLDRNDAAAAITQALLTMLPDMNLQTEGVGAVSDVAEHSLITTDVQKEGVSLWAVTWRMEVALLDWPTAPAIDPALYVGFAPKIGAAHVDDYIRVEGQP